MNEPGPVSNMFFRPEEIHGASGKGYVRAPIPKGNCHIGHQPIGFAFQNNSVPYLHNDRFSAIQTRGIDPDRLVREQPADCQRLKSSLAKPLLFVVNGDAVLGGKVAKWWKRADVIGIRK